MLPVLLPLDVDLVIGVGTADVLVPELDVDARARRQGDLAQRDKAAASSHRSGRADDAGFSAELSAADAAEVASVLTEFLQETSGTDR